MEDQEIMEQFIENKQGYVIDNMNAVAGCGGIGVGEVMGSSEEILGVKYDEQLHEKNDVGDDDELKYITEVQQSEKQHSMENVGDGRNSNELAEKEEEADKYKVGIDEENMHNQEDFENTTLGIVNDNSNGHFGHNKCDQLKKVGETPTPPAVCAGSEYIGYSSAEHYKEQYEMKKDEDDSSSLTPNTTNGSSLSKNLTQGIANVEEQTSHLIADVVQCQTILVTIDQNTDFEQTASQLNPEAKEFVPTFESNILTSNSPFGMSTKSSEEDEAPLGHVPCAVPRHLMAEDDFLAQSPRKGRGDNMDTISVPAVKEFEEEANQRPHELEVDSQANSVEQIIPNTEKAYQDTVGDLIVSEDSLLKSDSDLADNTANTNTFIDHGPETFVDRDVDINIGEHSCMGITEMGNDRMAQSMYVVNDEPIENVLNSVQPIPTEIDSVNNSFIEEVSAVVPIVDKEMLQVEEKEHISKSPSTEEIQIHLNSSDKDLFQVSLDMKDASMMQDSFYADQADQQGTSNCMDDVLYLAITDTTNLLKGADKGETTSDLQTINLENEHSNVFEKNYNQNQLYATHPSAPVILQKSSIDNLMSEMEINDGGIYPQVDEKEAEPVAISKDESKNSISFENVVNQCEPMMLIDENTYDTENGSIHHSPNQVQHTDLETVASVQKSKANEDDLVQTADHSADNKNASQLIVTIGAKEENIVKTDNLSKDDVISDVNVETSTIEISSNLGEVLNPITISDVINKSEHFELKQMGIGDTGVSGMEQLLSEYSCNEQEDTNETSTETIYCAGKDAGDQNIYEPIIVSLGHETRAEPSADAIIGDAVTEKVLEKVSSAACSTVSVKAALPLETCNTNSVKKGSVTYTSSALKAKITPPLLSSSKKLTITEVAKKPIGIATKAKLAAVKPSAISASSDKKLTKTTSVAAPIARKPMGTATGAPKIILKGNVPSRSTQITSVMKTTTSKPIAASRTISSALTTARKPAVSVTNTTAKIRPTSAPGVPAKSNTLGTPSTSTSKQKVASPRATLTSQMRKPAPSTATAKSPVKSTIPSSLTKPASSSLGTRPKQASSNASSGGYATIKTATARSAPKVASCSTTTTRHLTVGGTTCGTATTNTATKGTTARKSSPIKPAFGKTPTAHVASSTNSNIKSVIKPTSTKSTDNKLIEQSDMNGGITSGKATDLKRINGSSQEASVTGENQQSSLDHEDLNNPHINDSNLTITEDFKSGITDSLQDDLIGTYDH